MDIIRAGFDDTDIFSSEELDNGACCFYTDDKTCRYFFAISGQEAILHMSKQQCIDAAIDEFLFYSNYVACIKDAKGQVLRQRKPCELEALEIARIQPSQFFINERKLAACKQWIKSQNDVMIPIATVNGKIVSLDGHTRLRAALDLGYQQVYVYQDDSGQYIKAFVEEAIRRGIFHVTDMEIVSDEDYRIKWHAFCDDFFGKNN